MSEIKEQHQELMKAEILAAKGNEKMLYDLQPKAYHLLLQEFKQKAASKDPLKRLEEICKTYLNFGLENPETYELMFVPVLDESTGKVMLHNEKDVEVFSYFTDCLENCMRREVVRFKSAEVGALQIWSMMHGLISLNLRSRISVIGIADELVPVTLNKTVDHFLASITR